MYGTVARLRLKPGAEAGMQELIKEYEGLDVPGYVRSTVYKMEADSNEYYLTVLFEDRTSYRANAESPEQDARYQKMAALLDGEPEWHDGEVIYQGEPPCPLARFRPQRLLAGRTCNVARSAAAVGFVRE